jgi:hypothetical protein
MLQTRSSQAYISSGDPPKFAAEDILDAKLNGTLVINIHVEGESGQSNLEVARLVPHLSNGVFVVSERGIDPRVDDQFASLLKFIPAGKQRVCLADWWS